MGLSHYMAGLGFRSGPIIEVPDPPVIPAGPALMFWKQEDLYHSTVDSWRNAGTGGTDYDLILPRGLGGGGFPDKDPMQRLPAGGGNPRRVVFADGVLITKSLAPLTMAGQSNRTMGVYYKWVADVRNLIGYGYQTHHRGMDLITVNGSYLVQPHVYESSFNSPSTDPTAWILAEIRVTNNNDGSMTVERFLNGTYINSISFVGHTGNSFFIVGGGHYTGLNYAAANPGIIEIASAYAHDAFLTDAQMTQMRGLLTA